VTGKTEQAENPATPQSKAAGALKMSKKMNVQKTPENKVESTIKKPKPAKQERHKKPKVVRDSFTMPEDEYAHIAAIKARCLKGGVSAKKSEVLRAALIAFENFSDSELLQAISKLPTIKTGRPTNS